MAECYTLAKLKQSNEDAFMGAVALHFVDSSDGRHVSVDRGFTESEKYPL